MSKLVTINSTTSTTVTVGSLDRYIINGTTGTTYNYNLPSSLCDGMAFSFTRIDRTTAVVNLNGTIRYNGTNVTTYNIRSFATVTVISLGGVWNVVYDVIDLSVGLNNIFSGIFVGNNGNQYISVAANASFLFFSIPNSNPASIVSTVVISLGIASTGQTLYINGTLVVAITIPASVTIFTYTLTATDKNSLSTYGYISLINGPTILNVSSVIFYS